MRYVRQAVEPARFSSLDSALRTGLVEASKRLDALVPIAAAAVGAAPDTCFSALRHELSAHFSAINHAKPDQRRSLAEAAVLEKWRCDSTGLGLVSAATFRAQLGMLNRSLTDGGGGLRDGPMRLDGDKGGHQVFFPPPSAIPAQLEKLRGFLAAPEGAPALFRAAVAKVLLLNCHPFTDGNGRVARVLLNQILRQGGMPVEVYLPFYEIARRSNGGYEIALRQAEIRGEWDPFLRFMLAVVRCYRRIAVCGAHEPGTRPTRLAAAGDG